MLSVILVYSNVKSRRCSRVGWSYYCRIDDHPYSHQAKQTHGGSTRKQITPQARRQLARPTKNGHLIVCNTPDLMALSQATIGGELTLRKGSTEKRLAVQRQSSLSATPACSLASERAMPKCTQAFTWWLPFAYVPTVMDSLFF